VIEKYFEINIDVGSLVYLSFVISRRQTPPAQPIREPTEDDIINLMSMGFERDAVVAALMNSGNSVQIAADRLLTGGR